MVARPFPPAWPWQKARAADRPGAMAAPHYRDPPTRVAPRADPFGWLSLRREPAGWGPNVQVRSLHVLEPLRGHLADLLRPRRPAGRQMDTTQLQGSPDRAS